MRYVKTYTATLGIQQPSTSQGCRLYSETRTHPDIRNSPRVIYTYLKHTRRGSV